MSKTNKSNNRKVLGALILGAALSPGLAGLAMAGEVEDRWLKMIESGKAYPAETLLPLFEQLEPIDTDFMLGTWKGGKFDGGTEPDPINWYGKRFNSITDVEPLLVTDSEGKVQTFEKLGGAQMREIKYKGVSSAALIYDTQPIMDYFRKVNDNVVIGLGDIKGKPTDFVFHLTRE
ncbi:DUF4334 domain-containing protein [Halopseudomonas salina]|uniref:GXWXG protein n=1 Tax=Halopseudomonas salina TaxID=1323744 RepID=A0ABQ1PAT0_9GAMM|nr:DUF4334 domain-containing protein [Halopseudomonas salina]GGC92602.1 hypothetical protein GCM10007418_10180 [Halopseudomonas salina]